MPIVTLTQPEFLEATNATASQMASAWSEAAKGYGAWITLEQTSRVVSETEKFNRFAAELGKGFRDAAASATAWAQAARDAGRTGIADIMDKYGAKSAEKADRLLNQMMDQKENLNLIAAEARDAMAQGERAFGGGPW